MINSLTMLKTAAALLESTKSILWNPRSSNRASTRTPQATNIVTNSCCRSTIGSPPKPITKDRPSRRIISLWGPPSVGLQYRWFRSVALGKARSHMRSSTGKGSSWSVANLSSDLVLWIPPNMGWFIIIPEICIGSKSVCISYTFNPKKKTILPPQPHPYR